MAVRSAILLLITACTLSPTGGCRPLPQRTVEEQKMFGAVSFRIHPTFTQIKDFAGDKKPDGVETVIEFQDQFGDPTRAAGTVRFELYGFVAADPDHRGNRLAMWSAPLDTQADQAAHWDPAARGYGFQLNFPQIRTDRAYVLMAQFDRNNTRLFDRLILEPTATEGYHGDRRTQRAPTDAPAHGIF